MAFTFYSTLGIFMFAPGYVFVCGHHLLVTFGSTSYNSCVFVGEPIAVTSPDCSKISTLAVSPQAQKLFIS